MPNDPPIPAALSLDGLAGPARDSFDLAASAGYAGIAIATNHPELSPDKLDLSARRHVRKILDSKHLNLAALRIATPRGSLTDPATIDRTMDSARKAIDLARDLGIHTLALNLGNLASTTVSQSTLISALRQLAQAVDASGTPLSLAFSADTSAPLADILKQVDYDYARINLEGARLIAAGESPLDAAANFAGRIAQFTASDAIRAGSSLRPVELGQGQLPLSEILALLHEQGFRGPTVVDLRNLPNSPAAALHAAHLLRTALG